MKRLFGILLGFLLFSACDSSFQSSIPDYPVSLELDLRFEDKELRAVQAYKIYTLRNININLERCGFGGVLVYHGVNSLATDAFYAFDIACPYEAQSNITVEIDNEGIYAICPKCGSKYELINGVGNPVEGVSKEYLKQYRVDVDINGEKIYVHN